MRNLTCLLLLLAFKIATSQTAYIKQYSTEKAEMPITIVQMNNFNLIALCISDEMLGYTGSSKLIKTNNTGATEVEFSYELSGNSFYNITSILPVNESTFITVARIKSDQLPFGQIGVIKFDSSLNIIWEKKFAVNKPVVDNVFVTQNVSGNIVIGAGLFTESPPSDLSLVFMEITSNGDSIQSKYLTDGNPNFTNIYSMIQIGGQYKAFVNGYSSYVPNQGFSEILQLDSNFNLLGVDPVPYFIEEYMTAEKIDNSQYYLTGRAYSSATHYDVGIAKLSNSEDSITFNHTGKPGTAVDYSGWQKCMSIANSNSIYTGGTGNDNGIFWNCFTTNKVLMLSNYDSLLNCRWTRFYGSDTACYTMSTLEATSDGGCIMGGMFYTPSHPENLLDAVIIKVDSLGLFTGLHENTGIQIHEANIYPNPGSQNITVQCGPQIIGATFILYDAAGRHVCEALLKSTQFQLDVRHLSTGTYYWEILQKGRRADAGMWIKQQD
jgi:hypothetical protein